jgi:soluble lytic murein transglycosylase-like protein
VRSRFRRVLVTQFLAALAVGVSVPACADIWGYVDETGTARISTRQLDERYQLFFKGGTRVDAPDAATVAATQAHAAFEGLPATRRVMDHRNAERFQPLIDRHAVLQQVDPALVKAIIAVESSFEPDAVSPKGAIGLMQIIPETGERYGVVADARRSVEQKLRDPAINLSVGTRYLRDLLALFADDIELALAAYNAGEQTVERYGNVIPPFAETRAYVKRVRQFHSSYRPPPPGLPSQLRVVIPGGRKALVFSGDAPR